MNSIADTMLKERYNHAQLSIYERKASTMKHGNNEKSTGYEVAYIRVSTSEQNPARQKEMIMNYGIPEERIYCEKISGKNMDRPVLKKMLGALRANDTVVVASLDRLGRNTRDLLNLIEEFNKKKVRFVSLKENIDTSTPTGKFFLTIMAAIAEMEYATIRERQQAGIKLAKQEGRMNGRPRVKEDNFEAHYQQYKRGQITITQAAKLSNISRATFYRRMKEYEDKKMLNREDVS
jgi:DNA invertase Pin-like site-specific DNA recombinase